MAVGASEEDEFPVLSAIAVRLCVGVEGVAGDYYGGGIGDSASLDRYAACVSAIEAEEAGKGAGGVLFNEGQSRGGFVDMDIGVEGCYDEFCSEARGVG